MGKKKKGRVKQIPTKMQKVFGEAGRVLQSVSWHDRLPELLHISIALTENDYETVRVDFRKIATEIDERKNLKGSFLFNLSHTVGLIQQDPSLLDVITGSSFQKAFQTIFFFYREMLNIDYPWTNVEGRPIMEGYNQMLDGRSETAILSKYIMLEYYSRESPHFVPFLNLKTREEILEPLNVSYIMASFPAAIDSAEIIDEHFCWHIWLYNYMKSPFQAKSDSTERQEQLYQKMEMEKYLEQFKKLYAEFKKINPLAFEDRQIAEINMGFSARICDLTIDVVDLVRTHKGEIAELVLRSVIESTIVGAWLLKRNNPDLYLRFKNYSTGREKFMSEWLKERVTEEMKADADEIRHKAVKESGMRDQMISSEKGDIFEIQLGQMAEEVWGKDKSPYFLFKRGSEVTHGHWKVITKYHLSKSINPMHNGLLLYSENPNKFAGLIPSYAALHVATEFLIMRLQKINQQEFNELLENLKAFYKDIHLSHKKYFDEQISVRHDAM